MIFVSIPAGFPAESAGAPVIPLYRACSSGGYGQPRPVLARAAAITAAACRRKLIPL